ncbi:MAG: Xaa-Pro aminopeptidase [Gammaproteobacteria bacterium]|nr:Xaa-Pro aminopeptidase [Gammaproteobacteria bacterium]
MDRKEFARRRKRLMDLMGEDSIAVLPTSPVRPRNRDVEYPFRPDSDFYYLTGFAEPDAVMVLIPGRSGGQYLMFCRERDPDKEQWDGYRSGLEGAVASYGADDAFPIGDLDDILPGLMENRERVYYVMGVYPDFDRRVMDWVNRVRSRARAGVNAPGEFVALDHLIHELRLFKSKAEVKAMRQAMAVSCAAHVRAMQACRPGIKEYQLEAELIHEFMSGGARSPAYPSIVGSGANACVLHYIDNADTARDGELVLIDAGSEFDYYASDITRTFPVNGRFRPAQRALYEVVLEAQKAAIDKVRPGNHWNDPHEAAVAVIAEGLKDLGLVKGRLNKIIADGTYKPFYMHRTGHWLGMDVHDVGDYKVENEWRLLEPGMVMTVEPGVYVSAAHAKVARKWHDIGIRIEDDVLVTADGSEVLTAAAPKEMDDIEATMAGGA